MDKKCSNFCQVAYINRYVLTEGKQEGIKVVEINNGIIRATLNESKALDIMQVWYKGENISFVSKNGFTKRETPFLKRFEGGMLYTVGLDSAGGREGFETHGSFHNIPANIISCICNDERIEVIAEIEDSALFGKNLKLVRKISLAPMCEQINIEDTLINCGTKEENYCLLYHCNFGYPLLDENVEILFDGKKIIPRTELARERLNEVHNFLPPVENQEERCYFIENENPEVLVVNKFKKIKIKLNYSKDTLPKFVLWQSNASTDYALGIEPTTTFLDDFFEYNKIRPKNNEKFYIKITFDLL